DPQTCGLREARDVEDYAGRLGVSFQKLHHERAVPASNVHDPGKLSEIVGLDRGAEPVSNPTRARHRAVEHRAHFGASGEMLVEWHPQNTLACRLPGSYRCEDVRPQRIVHLAIEDHARLYRIGVVSSQVLTERRQPELAIAALVTRPDRDEPAQDTSKCNGID